MFAGDHHLDHNPFRGDVGITRLVLVPFASFFLTLVVEGGADHEMHLAGFL
jgi:hypothetical protein